jgi:gliding motility-associated lipoprotein GldD
MRNSFLLVLISLPIMFSCKQDYSPKPRGYFRIDFPAKEYQVFKSECSFSFEYPVYGEVEIVKQPNSSQCWQNISFSDYNAKIHLTYLPLNNDLSKHSEDIRSLVYKHIIKADDIKEERVNYSENNVYGIIYTLSGNTASSLSFILTDSVEHFLSGALYFSSIPNQDSLAPAIQFFQEDVVHLTESLTWN